MFLLVFFCKQKTAYEMRISDWSSDVCSSDLFGHAVLPTRAGLVPLTLSGTHLERLEGLSGVSLPVEASCNGKSFNNFMLVTHRGLSGPSILQISSYWQPGDALRLDLLPTLAAEAFLREQRQSRPIGGAPCRERGCQKV